MAKINPGKIPVLKERLNDLRSEYQTDKEFAEALGISVNSAGFWLSGDRVPNAENLIAISKKTGYSVDWLLGLAEQRSPDQSVQALSKSSGLSEIAATKLCTLFGCTIPGEFEPISALNLIIEAPSFKYLIAAIMSAVEIEAEETVESLLGIVNKDISPELVAEYQTAFSYQELCLAGASNIFTKIIRENMKGAETNAV